MEFEPLVARWSLDGALHIDGGSARLVSALRDGKKVTLRNSATNSLSDIRIIDGELVLMSGTHSIQAEKMTSELIGASYRDGTAAASPAQGAAGG